MNNAFVMNEQILNALLTPNNIKMIVFSDEHDHEYGFLYFNGGVKNKVLKHDQDTLMIKQNGKWNKLTLPEYSKAFQYYSDKNIIWLFETLCLSFEMRIGMTKQPQVGFTLDIGRYLKKISIVIYY